MPRTIESIVANHNSALERRKNNQPIWAYKVNIVEIINENTSEASTEVIASKANQIAVKLQSHLPKTFFDYSDPDCDLDFLDTYEMMKDCVSTLFSNQDEAEETFNEWLDAIYDWADRERIWLGN